MKDKKISGTSHDILKIKIQNRNEHGLHCQKL